MWKMRHLSLNIRIRHNRSTATDSVQSLSSIRLSLMARSRLASRNSLGIRTSRTPAMMMSTRPPTDELALLQALAASQAEIQRLQSQVEQLTEHRIFFDPLNDSERFRTGCSPDAEIRRYYKNGGFQFLPNNGGPPPLGNGTRGAVAARISEEEEAERRQSWGGGDSGDDGSTTIGVGGGWISEDILTSDGVTDIVSVGRGPSGYNVIP